MSGEDSSSYQRQKSVFSAQTRLFMLLIAVCLSLRFVPALNNWLSGPAQPVRALTRALARLTAEQTGGEFPVLVLRDEDDLCNNITRVDAESLPGALYYVWTYSERQHLSCLTSYEAPADGFKGREAQTAFVNPAQAESFGRELSEPVKVVPIDRTLKVHGQEYLHMLDWRTEVHFPLTHEVSGGQTFYDPRPGKETIHSEIGFADLRADVARRHNWVNAILWSVTGLFLLLFAKTRLNLRRLYRQFNRQYPSDDSPLAFRAFVKGDLNVIVAQRERHSREQRERAEQEARGRRLRAEMEGKLRYMHDTTTDESLRSRIAAILADPQTALAAMQALWEEGQQQPSHNSPQERLAVLLDSFQQYCKEEEWEECAHEAHSILEQSGFRPAREYAIEMHDRFRAREKAKEEEAKASGED
jgi:hypothetical protein